MNVPFTRQFGIELDFAPGNIDGTRLANAIRSKNGKVCTSDYSQQHHNDYWVTRANSYGGFEIASPIMNSAEDLQEGVEVVRVLQSSGAKVDYHCDLCVRVGADDFDEEKLATLVQWWIKFEQFIAANVLGQRLGNNYYYGPFNRVFYVGGSYNTEQTLLGIAGRRNSLNISCYQRRRIIEFWIVQGTKDFVDVQNCVRFLLTFVEFAKTAPRPGDLRYDFPDDVLNRLGLIKDDLPQDLLEMRTWLLNSALHNVNKSYSLLIKHLQKELGNE